MSLQFPASPTVGQIFPSPLVPGQPSWTWNGNRWVSGGFSGAVVSTTPMPPTNPRVGDLWFDPQQGQTYVWFDDGTSQQWVIAINQSNLMPEPPSDGQAYMRRNGVWVPMTVLTAVLSANLALPSAQTQVLSIDAGTTGAWLVWAEVLVTSATGASNAISCNLRTGSASYFAGASVTIITGGAGTIPLTGLIVNPTGPIILGAYVPVVGMTAQSNYTGSSRDTTMIAMRIG